MQPMRAMYSSSVLALLLLGAGCATEAPSTQQSNSSAINKPAGDHDPEAPEDFELRFGKIIKVADTAPFTLDVGSTGKIGLDFGGGVMDFYVTVEGINKVSSRYDAMVRVETSDQPAKSFTLSKVAPTAQFGRLQLTLVSSASGTATFTASEK